MPAKSCRRHGLLLQQVMENILKQGKQHGRTVESKT